MIYETLCYGADNVALPPHIMRIWHIMGLDLGVFVMSWWLE